jgi:group II intron reverse transcriptase/maturase
MQTSLRGIAKKAKENPKHKFGNLYSLLNERNLKWSFPQLNRKAAPGVDDVDYEEFKSNLDENVRNIVRELMCKRYKAKLVRRRYIPKSGGRRPLGIPVVGDKTLQTAVASILSAIYEADFMSFSHGYRRGKGPQKAALKLSELIHRGKYRWIVDADIKGFFDNLNHDWLIRMLSERIKDKSFLGLIKKWLKAGILEEDGQVIYPVTGTPQGGTVSAVLANIYLHYALDIWFEKVVKSRCDGDVMLMRYADDFVVCFQYHRDARKFYNELGERLMKFCLELSQEKTRMIKFTRFITEGSEVFTFLGFEYRWGVSRKGKPLVKMRTSKSKFKSAIANFLSWIKKKRSKLGTRALFVKWRQKLQGHFNYYGVSGNIEMLMKYYHETLEIMFKWLNRRSQRKSCTFKRFIGMVEYFRIPRPRIIGYWD